jgi:hypothetical protein
VSVRLSRLCLWTAMALRVATVVLIFVALTHMSSERFANKAFGARAILYPGALAVVPLVWWFARRRTGRILPFPAVADFLFAVPWVIDLVGNTVNAYDRVDWFDDAAHFVNWFFIVGALAALLPLSLAPLVRLGLCMGLGCFAALGWEIGEYYTFIRHSSELRTAYTDTLFDMSMGTAGSLLAGLIGSVMRR